MVILLLRLTLFWTNKGHFFQVTKTAMSTGSATAFLLGTCYTLLNKLDEHTVAMASSSLNGFKSRLNLTRLRNRLDNSVQRP